MVRVKRNERNERNERFALLFSRRSSWPLTCRPMRLMPCSAAAFRLDGLSPVFVALAFLGIPADEDAYRQMIGFYDPRILATLATRRYGNIRSRSGRLPSHPRNPRILATPVAPAILATLAASVAVLLRRLFWRFVSGGVGAVKMPQLRTQLKAFDAVVL